MENKLTPTMIIKILGHKSGKANLTAFLDHESELLRLGFTRVQIIEIVGRNDGARFLASVIAHGPAFLAAGYTPDDVVNIVRSGGQWHRRALSRRPRPGLLDVTSAAVYFYRIIYAGVHSRYAGLMLPGEGIR